MVAPKKAILSLIYKRLHGSFGPQHWWPATPLKRGGEARPIRKTARGRPADPIEVMVGAILTQNTNWGNVEKAIANLKRQGICTPAAVKRISYKKLASLIKPAGYFNVKARRLKNFVRFLFKEYKGDIRRMKKDELTVLRPKLLSVNGIGPETADSILLYALDKPTFVVDAYTKRIFSRHHLCSANDTYHQVQELFSKALKPNVKTFNEYHALIVRLGKDFCKPKARCSSCPLNFLNRERRYKRFRFSP
ncbi:MAG TPA: endonuclease III domain-containing protein [Candidatus Omnitrophota bacterium]|nr:endonuclease III domain-containing protein [Candidatus Omnitrophota bacterium]